MFYNIVILPSTCWTAFAGTTPFPDGGITETGATEVGDEGETDVGEDVGDETDGLAKDWAGTPLLGGSIPKGGAPGWVWEGGGPRLSSSSSSCAGFCDDDKLTFGLPPI
jgi:hypothetical protein